MLDIILKYIYENSTKVMVKSRAIQTQPKPDNLAKPLDANPIPTQTEGPVGRWWVFRSKKPTLVGRVAGLHLQNLSNLNQTRATKKPSQILQKQARSDEISTRSD